MGESHAVLSPSSAARWINCPASVKLSESIPPRPSGPAAEEGTKAHAVAAALVLGEVIPDYADDQMIRHGQAYAEYVHMIAAQYETSVLFVEERVEVGIDEVYGTADAIVVGIEPDGRISIHVIDYKYGRGVWVSPEGNEQLMCYGLGALDLVKDLFGDVAELVLTIVQPRTGDGEPKAWIISADDLMAWRDGVRPVAAEALAGSDTFGPSEKACQWCPAAGVCSARADWLAAECFEDRQEPEIMSPERMAEVIELAPAIRSWLDSVEAEGLRLTWEDETPLPGFKVIERPGRRYVADEDRAVFTLRGKGFTDDQFLTSKVVGVTALEKLLGGRKALEAVLGDDIATKPGPKALVHEDHRATKITRGGQVEELFGD